MSPEETVRSTLAAAAPVTALAADRIYPDEIPQDDVAATEPRPPAIVYRRAGTEPRFTLNDTLALTRAVMRVVCWAASRVTAETLGDAVQAALIAAKIMPVGRDGFTDPDTGDEAAIVDVEVWY